MMSNLSKRARYISADAISLLLHFMKGAGTLCRHKRRCLFGLSCQSCSWHVITAGVSMLVALVTLIRNLATMMQAMNLAIMMGAAKLAIRKAARVYLPSVV